MRYEYEREEKTKNYNRGFKAGYKAGKEYKDKKESDKWMDDIEK